MVFYHHDELLRVAVAFDAFFDGCSPLVGLVRPVSDVILVEEVLVVSHERCLNLLMPEEWIFPLVVLCEK